jgi:hypothetical protein
MSTLRGLLKAVLVIILAAGVTLALLLHSANEQQNPDSDLEQEACPAPDGWSAHLVQVGENLTVLADIVGVEPAEIVIANCLLGDVHPGDTVYLPPPILSSSACGPPADWLLYEIQPGDTLPILAKHFSVSEAALWHANCMSESMTFPPGFRIFVPPFADIP